MAKLSAHGRTLVATAIKEAPYTGAIPEGIQCGNLVTRNELRLMSDRVTLIKRSSLEDGKVKYASGWTVHGRLKDGVTTEQWCNSYRAKGWEVTTQ
jgi:hypothetical protein